MDDARYEKLVKQLGTLNEHLRQLTDTDYATAMYKGYSSSGQTLEEINEAIETTEAKIAQLEERLQDY